MGGLSRELRSSQFSGYTLVVLPSDSISTAAPGQRGKSFPLPSKGLEKSSRWHVETQITIHMFVNISADQQLWKYFNAEKNSEEFKLSGFYERNR